MVKIRLKRMGSKFNAFYRIVAADERFPRDGRFIEELGHYDPYTKKLVIDKQLSLKWLSNGAQLSETVKNLFTQEKILEEFNKTKLGKKITKKSKSRKKTKTKESKTKKESKKSTKKTPKIKKEEVK